MIVVYAKKKKKKCDFHRRLPGHGVSRSQLFPPHSFYNPTRGLATDVSYLHLCNVHLQKNISPKADRCGLPGAFAHAQVWLPGCVIRAVTPAGHTRANAEKGSRLVRGSAILPGTHLSFELEFCKWSQMGTVEESGWVEAPTGGCGPVAACACAGSSPQAPPRAPAQAADLAHRCVSRSSVRCYGAPRGGDQVLGSDLWQRWPQPPQLWETEVLPSGAPGPAVGLGCPSLWSPYPQQLCKH